MLPEGWLTPAEAWTFASFGNGVGVITIPEGDINRYPNGTRVWFKQGTPTATNRYGVVIASTTTTLTVVMVASTILENLDIQQPAVSSELAPRTPQNVDFTTFSKGWGTNTADINISTSGNYSSLTSVTIKLNKAGTVEINALATIKLANNQETNIRLMNGSTGLFEISHQSSDTTLIRTHGANIQVDLPAGTHNLLLQIRAFGGSAGTHMIYTRNATMSVQCPTAL